jgi:hypothetical protein
VLLAAQRQADLIEVVVHVDGIAQRLEVLLLDAGAYTRSDFSSD